MTNVQELRALVHKQLLMVEHQPATERDIFRESKGSPNKISIEGIWALPKWLLHPLPRTQTGTLGHFISKKVPQTIRARV